MCADALLPSTCPLNAFTNVFQSGSSLAKKVYAVALNHAINRGVFEPYREAQRIFLQWAAHVACNLDPAIPSNTLDRSIAEVLMDRLLAAQ
jgi:hypothetical protein